MLVELVLRGVRKLAESRNVKERLLLVALAVHGCDKRELKFRWGIATEPHAQVGNIPGY